MAFVFVLLAAWTTVTFRWHGQGIADAPGGAELQAWFREARLHHFRLEPGARVRPLPA